MSSFWVNENVLGLESDSDDTILQKQKEPLNCIVYDILIMEVELSVWCGVCVCPGKQQFQGQLTASVDSQRAP